MQRDHLADEGSRDLGWEAVDSVSGFLDVARTGILLPSVGAGETLRRWTTLRSMSRRNPSVGRLVEAHCDAQSILQDPLSRSRWFLIPVQDLVSFAFWVGGFFGNSIMWRGIRYRLLADGRFERI